MIDNSLSSVIENALNKGTRKELLIAHAFAHRHIAALSKIVSAAVISGQDLPEDHPNFYEYSLALNSLPNLEARIRALPPMESPKEEEHEHESEEHEHDASDELPVDIFGGNGGRF